jgi:predicted HTH domain antitoxin
MSVTLNLHLPDDIVTQLAVGGRDLERAALEAFAVEEYRAKRITHAQVAQLLGLSRWAVDGLLKEHEVWLDYTVEDFRREGEAWRQIREQHPSNDRR